jgi:hypothetical protein
VTRRLALPPYPNCRKMDLALLMVAVYLEALVLRASAECIHRDRNPHGLVGDMRDEQLHQFIDIVKIVNNT